MNFDVLGFVPDELLIVVVAVGAWVWAARKAGLPGRWTPLTAVLSGAAAACAVAGVSPSVALTGAVAGAAATGLHQTYEKLAGS